MAPPQAQKQSYQHINPELRDMISILTGLGRSSDHGEGNDSAGIITLTGTNKGAMMKMDGLDPASDTEMAVHRDGRQGVEAFANSNYQSINNSIVMGGSCHADDPGVHLLIEDFVEEEGDGEDDGHHEKKSKTKKKKEVKEKEKDKRKKDKGEGKEHVNAEHDESSTHAEEE
ncbi:hypothetical protein HPP92_021255 [Vanilla planifolia]|uniref:Uncharacterized protein n=1 Tax=Vanilla planifolia TaxID=51239 RepID=A0A835Q491_VANPL|nr:hypothetical protein HPP92_021255 [Vanilla planifolia]